jgi:hypothetical protein
MITHTPHSKANQRFTDAAHECAKAVVYPDMFGVERHQIDYTPLDGDEERARLLDTTVAVDRLFRVTVTHLRLPIPSTIQERFRRVEYAKFDDITITEWNNNTNLPSELYKIRADWFVYGYFDQERRHFLRVVAVPMPNLKRMLVRDELPHAKGQNPRTGQTFITIRMPDLYAHNLVAWDYQGAR